jgi:hypothetical protein
MKALRPSIIIHQFETIRLVGLQKSYGDTTVHLKTIYALPLHLLYLQIVYTMVGLSAVRAYTTADDRGHIIVQISRPKN